MYPFFHIFSFDIPAYGSMMALAAITSYMLIWWQTRKTSLWEDAFNYFFFAMVGALTGAFLLYAAINLPAVIADWDNLIAPLGFKDAMLTLGLYLGGFVFYGGLIGAAAAMMIYAKIFKTPLLPYLDVIAPTVPVLHAIGRVGCFLGGCCYGIEVSHTHPLGVIYPEYSLSAPPGIPLLPVQLIETCVNLLIALGLFIYKRKNPPLGVMTGLYLITYAASRFVLEFFRGDAFRGIYFGVSTSQIISALLFISGAALLAAAFRRKPTIA